MREGAGSDEGPWGPHILSMNLWLLISLSSQQDQKVVCFHLGDVVELLADGGEELAQRLEALLVHGAGRLLYQHTTKSTSERENQRLARLRTGLFSVSISPPPFPKPEIGSSGSMLHRNEPMLHRNAPMLSGLASP